MRRRQLVLVPLLLALLVACGDDGGSDGEASTSETTTTPLDTGGAAGGGGDEGGGERWAGVLEAGTPVSAELWVEPTDDPIRQWDELRVLLDGPEYQLTEVTVDNSGGAQQETGRFLSFVEGDDVLDDEAVTDSTFVCSLLDRWEAPATDDEVAAYDAVVTDLCQGQTAQVLVPAGEVVTYWVAVEGDSPPEFDTIYAGVTNELRPA
jgi:hypothetical protein